MPANWKYIKGLNQKEVSGEVVSYYTYLRFLDTENQLPHIITNHVEDDINGQHAVDWGAILCSGKETSTQHIVSNLEIGTSDTTQTETGLTLYQNSFLSVYLDFNRTKKRKIVYLSDNILCIGDDTEDSYTKISILNDLYLKQSLVLGPAAKTHSEQGNVYANNLYALHKCEAGFFNTTSDKRAKEDLKPLDIKALDLINKIPLYSFTYKDTQTPSIGIIAQDILPININNFKFVDNENATGEDMDYMTIHESKLVYILWKAIQEQQKEIEELKKLIK